MRPRHFLITTALSVVLGASGFAVAQDRLNDKVQSTQPQNSMQQRQTTGQQPSSATSSTTQESGSSQNSGGTTRAQQPSNVQSNPQNAQGGSGTGQSSAGMNQQPSSAQSNQPANNQPSSAQTNQQSDQPSSAQSNTTNQPTSAQSNTSNQPSSAQRNTTQQPSTAQQPAQKGTNQNTAQQGQTNQSNVRLSASLQSSDRARLHAEIGRLNVRPITNVNFSVSVGTVVPRSVTLSPLPASFVEIIPQYRGYRFFVVRDEVVIVEPNSFRIVDVIERSGGGSRAQATTSQRKLNLSSQQRDTIRKHYSSKKKTVTTGAATRSEKIVVGEDVPESVTIERFPEEVYRDVPAVRDYRYVQGDRGLYIVEPQSRRVIEELD